MSEIRRKHTTSALHNAALEQNAPRSPRSFFSLSFVFWLPALRRCALALVALALVALALVALALCTKRS